MREVLGRVAPLAGLAVVAAASPVAATPEVPTEPVEIGVFSQPVRLVGGEATTLTLDDGSRYGDVLEVRPVAGGDLQVVNDVTMRTYVEGLGEVPFSWPMEALKAQVVAARTYAWFSIRQGSYDRFGYDICDTTACQVYRGRDQDDDPSSDRWRQAVAETEGEVLVHGGRPILARYFSTSGGHTRDNEEVFPSEGPRPYLKGVPDPDDAVSPLHRWEVTFTREQFDEILGRGRSLAAAVPVTEIRYVDPPTGSDRVVVSGGDGGRVEVPASSFRAFVSATAPELYPEEYPARWPGRDRRYPETLLSSRLAFELTEDRVVVRGRGWGHGVGMGQYGAMGKAERGMAYDEILASYYNGLRPTRPASLPDRVRVGVDRRSEPLTVRADAPVRVVVGDRVITDRGLGTWRLEPRGDRVALLAPPGFGSPLAVAATASSRGSPYPFERVTLRSRVNKPAEVRLEVRRDGEPILTRAVGIVDPGEVTTSWRLQDGAGEPVPPGSYDVELVAVDEEGASAGGATTVEVREPQAPATLSSALPPAPPGDGGSTPVWLPLLVAALAGAVAGLATGWTVPVSAPREAAA